MIYHTMGTCLSCSATTQGNQLPYINRYIYIDDISIYLYSNAFPQSIMRIHRKPLGIPHVCLRKVRNNKKHFG